jgi:hypothetical protein
MDDEVPILDEMDPCIKNVSRLGFGKTIQERYSNGIIFAQRRLL